MKRIYKYLLIIALLFLVGCEKKYTVTVDPDGGDYSGLLSQKIVEGECAIFDNDPVRVGYTFNGWKCVEDENIETTSLITSNLTFTAQWISDVTYEINESTKEICITGLNNNTITNLVILSEYDGCKVTSINKRAFYQNKTLESITLPDSLIYIDDYAFCDTNLKSIEIGSGLTSFGTNIFSGSSNLESIVVSENNKTFDSRDNCNAIIKTETNELLYGCSKTTIPSSIKSIGDYAFSANANITEVIIPEGVESIGDFAFESCISLMKVSIPNSIKSLGYACFQGTFLDSYCKVYRSGYYLGNDTNPYLIFMKPTYIYSTSFSINTDTKIIYSDAFYNNMDLTSVTLPDGLIQIGRAAFMSCSSLESINIPEGLSRIESSAFKNCYSLKTIVLPSSITYIGDKVFNYQNLNVKDTSLISESIIVNYAGTMAQWEKIEKGNDWNYSEQTHNIYVYCSDGNI